jgi:hypothetical protein
MLQGPDKMVGMESEGAWTEDVPVCKDQLMLWIGKRDGIRI